tara:strand:- start:3471 stop:4004 length:534 start_codon:yes stop_codon:yes gene_type:complete
MYNKFLSGVGLVKKDLFPLILILLMVFSRLIPHPPNFTPIIAVAIMSGYLFKNLYLSISVLFFSMIVVDMFIGFYSNMFFVYFPLFIIAYFCFFKNKKINAKNLFIYGISSSLIFFIISNFGVWVSSDMYEKNIAGLVNCYIMAIPFLKNTLISTVLFSYLSFISVNTFNKIAKKPI